MKRPIPYARGLGLLSLALSAGSSQAAITFVNSTSSAGFGSVAVLDDFESFAPKDVALPSLISGGITYNALNQNVVVASPGYTNFGVAGATTTSILCASGDEDFEMLPSFFSPARIRHLYDRRSGIHQQRSRSSARQGDGNVDFGFCDV